jgi:hypothetical protein
MESCCPPKLERGGLDARHVRVRVEEERDRLRTIALGSPVDQRTKHERQAAGRRLEPWDATLKPHHEAFPAPAAVCGTRGLWRLRTRRDD